MSERIRPGKLPRQEVPKRPAEERVKDFNEVVLGFDEEHAVLEAMRCLQCDPAPCVEGCPVHQDIPGFIKLIKERKFDEAYFKVREHNLLSAITGRVCPYEKQCEGACILTRAKKPIAIGALERFVSDWGVKHGLHKEFKKKEEGRGKVAIVGSGPAGLQAAGQLALLGYEVVLFEALHKPGGVLMYGIPEYRLPKKVIEEVLKFLREAGVELREGSPIGRVMTIHDLLKDGYRAVLIGTGAGMPRFLNLPGENLPGVYSANEFLIRVNLMKANLFPEYPTPVKVGEKVVVIGGGDTAMDSARTALRLGAEVSILYRRGREEAPAGRVELEEAIEEGAEFVTLTNPVEFLGDGRVKKVRCIRMRLGEPDESGRRRPIPIPGSEFEVEADTAIVAIGYRINPLIARTTPDLKVHEWYKTILVDENYQTSIKGVFAAGDVVTGEATVAKAIGASKVAVRAIHRLLKEG